MLLNLILVVCFVGLISRNHNLNAISLVSLTHCLGWCIISYHTSGPWSNGPYLQALGLEVCVCNYC
jgi:hypothetical protein